MSIVEECFLNKPKWILWNKIFRMKILKEACTHTIIDYVFCDEDVYLFFIFSYFSSSFKKIYTEPFYTYRVCSGITTKGLTINNYEKIAYELLVVEKIKNFILEVHKYEDYKHVIDKIENTLLNDACYRCVQLPKEHWHRAISILLKYHDTTGIKKWMNNYFGDQNDDIKKVITDNLH